MLDDRPRWGILSTAGIAARALIPALRESAGAVLVGVAGRERERAASFAAAHDVPHAYGSYELLADERIEAVYVPLPNSLHVEWSVRALDASKHVLCEKPMDKSAEQVERAFAAAEAADRLLMEVFMWRHHLDTIAILDLVVGGAIGEVCHVRSSFSFTLPGGANIRLNPNLDGGALMDVGCYAVSALRLFAGEPSSVSASFVLGPSGVDASVAAMLTFGGGVTGSIFSSIQSASSSVIEVLGSERALVMQWPFAPFVPAAIELRRRESVESLPVSSDNRYRRMVDNFNDAIRGRAEPLLGRADAVAQARTVEAIRQSALSGGAPVSL